MAVERHPLHRWALLGGQWNWILLFIKYSGAPRGAGNSHAQGGVTHPVETGPGQTNSPRISSPLCASSVRHGSGQHTVGAQKVFAEQKEMFLFGRGKARYFRVTMIQDGLSPGVLQPAAPPWLGCLWGDGCPPGPAAHEGFLEPSQGVLTCPG